MSRSTRPALRLLRRRALVRSPLWLYRLGLGFLLSTRMLRLEHIGRASGLRRQVVLEVAARPGRDRFLVVSGFGDHAQWYRNVLAHPRVRVSTGWRRSVPATAARVPVDRARRLFEHEYPEAHPHVWAHLEPVLRSACAVPDSEPLATHVPVVELRLDRAEPAAGRSLTRKR